MKKLIVLIALSTYAFGFSQIREKGNVELSPFFGISKVNNKVNSALPPRGPAITRVRFGTNIDYYLHSNWSIRSGIIYDPMGGTDNVQTRYELNYLNMPLNINFHFGRKRGFNLNAGVMAGIFLKGQAIEPFGEVTEITEFVKPTQLGLSFGGGYKHQITEKLSLFLDFQMITETDNYIINVSGFDFKSYNYGYSINLGTVFKL